MPRRPDIRDRIDAFRSLCEREDPEPVLEACRKTLRDRHPLLVGKAAELAADRLLYALEWDLIAAYRRFLENPAKRDPGCMAKGSIARALVALDCRDADFFVGGIRYRQPEPVWGGSVDTAVDLRVSCAIGLAATSEPRALIYLVELLYDPEPHARSGAARAIACVQPMPAEAVLRAKALGGDPEPEVTGEVLVALLQVAGEDGLDFVADFLDSKNPEIQGLAALALGGSRLESALDRLRARWAGAPLKRGPEHLLLRAAALHRSDAALDWLLSIVADADPASAEVAIAELLAYCRPDRFLERLRAALAERADPRLASAHRRILDLVGRKD